MPPPEINRIEFTDIWHPLDHLLLSARCRKYPSALKGAKLHIRYWWAYRAPERLTPLYRRVLCSRGWHYPLMWWRGRGEDATSGTFCAHCDWTPESEKR